MSDVFASDFSTHKVHFAEYGNAWTGNLSFKKAAAIGDKIYFGRVGAGSSINDLKMVNDGVASATIKLGFESIDPNDGPAADDDYFFSATSIATAGTIRSDAKPVTFEREVAVVGVVAGAALTASDQLIVVLSGQMIGSR